MGAIYRGYRVNEYSKFRVEAHLKRSWLSGNLMASAAGLGVSVRAINIREFQSKMVVFPYA